MGSMGIDGIVSGLDTTSLINSLMQVEAMPQTLLKQKVITAVLSAAEQKRWQGEFQKVFRGK